MGKKTAMKRTYQSRSMAGKLVAAVVLLACAAVGFATAPRARADDMAYLQALNNAGMTIYDTGLAIQYGYRICTALSGANGEEVAQAAYRYSKDITSIEMARAWVLIAAGTLCPWQIHPPTQGT
jgi:hypothetical protein